MEIRKGTGIGTNHVPKDPDNPLTGGGILSEPVISGGAVSMTLPSALNNRKQGGGKRYLSEFVPPSIRARRLSSEKDEYGEMGGSSERKQRGP